MIAENGSPIDTDFLHHLRKLHGIYLLILRQYDITREHNEIGLDILYMPDKHLGCLFVIAVICVIVEVGARKNDKIFIADSAVSIEFGYIG